MAFLLILTVLLGVYFRIVTPKYYTDQIYSTTTTYRGFYNLKKDSLDVIFLGSSHGSTSFIPQELYDSYGIRSYNLSCEMQNLATSYYWLKEALLTQHPKAVVIECTMLVTDLSEEEQLEDYYCTKKALDVMHFGLNKYRASAEMADYFDKSISDFMWPNVSYHERWKSLENKDFSSLKWDKFSEMRGYTVIPIESKKKFKGYNLNVKNLEKSAKTISEENQKRMDRIVSLCSDNDIELILTVTPARSLKSDACLAVEKYAEDNGLAFIDFDETKVLNEMKYDFKTMNSDKGHLNIRGAEKVSNYIGSYLADELGFTPAHDDALESTSEYYDYLKKRCGIMYITDADEYLESIDDDRFTVTEKVKEKSTDDGSLVYNGTDYSLDKIGTNILVVDNREGTVVDCALIRGKKVSHSKTVVEMLN